MIGLTRTQNTHEVFSWVFVLSCCAFFLLSGRSLIIAVKGFVVGPLYCPPALLCSCDEWRARRRKYLIRHREALDLIEIGNDEDQFFEQIVVKMQIGTTKRESSSDSSSTC